MDLTAGPEMGLGQNSYEKGFATENNGNKFTTNLDRDYPKTDVRLRLNMATFFGETGILFSYSHGLSNYQANLEGANFKTYARIFRLGVGYRIK